jgi:hypothetical protein
MYGKCIIEWVLIKEKKTLKKCKKCKDYTEIHCVTLNTRSPFHRRSADYSQFYSDGIGNFLRWIFGLYFPQWGGIEGFFRLLNLQLPFTIR